MSHLINPLTWVIQAFIFKMSYYLNLSHITYSISENAEVEILKRDFTTFGGRRNGTASTFNPGK